MSKSVFQVVIALLLTIGGFEFFKYQNQDHKLDPKNLSFRPVSDSFIRGGGQSEVKIDTTNFSYTYTLRPGAEYPFAGIEFKRKDGGFFPINNGDFIFFELSATQGSVLPVLFCTEYKVPHPVKDQSDYQFSEINLNLKDKAEKVIVDLSTVKTSPWWMRLKNINTIKQADFSKVAIMKLQSCQILETGIEDTVKVHSITIRKNYQIINFIFYTTVLLTIIFVSYRYVQARKRDVVLHYEPTENVLNENDYVSYLSKNYHNPELSMQLLCEEFGTNSKVINASLKEATELNFKQLLNSFRMEEAKRLLIETNERPSDIAFKVGFENVSHFNRVFKATTSISPTEYRKNPPEPKL